MCVCVGGGGLSELRTRNYDIFKKICHPHPIEFLVRIRLLISQIEAIVMMCLSVCLSVSVSSV